MQNDLNNPIFVFRRNTMQPYKVFENAVVREQFIKNGLSIADWANQNNFPVALVYQIIRGERKCLRGMSHQIAIKLGIKNNG